MYKSVFHIANAKKRREVDWHDFTDVIMQAIECIAGKRLHSIKIKRRSFVLYTTAELSRKERTSLGRLLVRIATELVAYISIYTYKRKNGGNGVSRQLLRLKSSIQVEV